MDSPRHRWRARPWVWFLFAGVVFFAAEYLWLETGGLNRPAAWRFFGMPSGCPAGPERADHGQTDYQWALQTLDEREVALEQFRGQVMFVNIWATWCGPCVAEMPSIQRLYESTAGSVVFLLVSDEDPNTIRRFVDKHQLTVPVYRTEREAPAVFASRGIPATFILDRAGTVVHRRIGGAAWDTDGCRDLLRSLTAATAAQPVAAAVLR